MKAPLGIALMVLVASAPTTFAQLPDPRPDLVIAGIVTSKQRVGVDETFYHAVTDRNAGRTPCNFVNLTLKLPGEVDLDGASSKSPPGLRLLTRTSPPRSMTRLGMARSRHRKTDASGSSLPATRRSRAKALTHRAQARRTAVRPVEPPKRRGSP
jgi:hypothetical protein